MPYSRRVGVVALVLPFLFACSDSPTTPDKSGLAPATASDEYVATPAGLYHRSCVHLIDEGAVLEANNRVRVKGGASYQIPDCAYPPLDGPDNRPRPFSQVQANGNDPNTGIFQRATYHTNGSPIRLIQADFSVPLPPLVSYLTNTQTYFTFPGLQNATYFMQPVLQYGVSGAGGGAYWALASWRCSSQGGSCVHGPLKQVSPGDYVSTLVQGYNCDINNLCTWSVAAWDQTSGDSAVLTTSATMIGFDAIGGMMEARNLTSCDQLPVNGPTFSNIAVATTTGGLTPTWSTLVSAGNPSGCGYLVTTTSSQVHLIHTVSNTNVTTSQTGMTASATCGLCNVTPVINAITASGNVITLHDNGGHTATITLSNATASGGLTASLPPCVCAQPPAAIVSVAASATHLTITDNGGHTGTMNFSGANLHSITGGLSAGTCVCSTPRAILSTYGTGTVGLRLADNTGHTGYVKFD